MDDQASEKAPKELEDEAADRENEDLLKAAEVDLNPVIVCQDGTEVVDARTRVEQHAPPRPERARPRPHRAPDHA